jgi:hypothetical protein
MTDETNEEQKEIKPFNADKVPVLFGDKGLELKTMDDVWRFATIIKASNLAPKGLATQEDIFVAIVNGGELGLSPLTSVQNTAVINGRPSVFGQIPLALCRASGLVEEFEETMEFDSDGKCIGATCRTKRRGDTKSISRTFTEKDAQRAGLMGRDTYKQFPQRMLPARARGYCLGDAYPDVLKGVMTVEEVQDLPEVKKVNAVVVDTPPDTTAPQGGLDAVTKRLKKQPPQDEGKAPEEPAQDVLEEGPGYPTADEIAKMSKDQLRDVCVQFDLTIPIDTPQTIKACRAAVGEAFVALEQPPE